MGITPPLLSLLHILCFSVRLPGLVFWNQRRRGRRRRHRREYHYASEHCQRHAPYVKMISSALLIPNIQ